MNCGVLIGFIVLTSPDHQVAAHDHASTLKIKSFSESDDTNNAQGGR